MSETFFEKLDYPFRKHEVSVIVLSTE